VNNFPQDNHKKFVDFLRQNYPAVPPSYHGEERLMQKIERYSLRNARYPYGLLLAIPSAMVTGAFLTWNNINLKPNSISVASKNNEIDTFLVNSWTNTLEYRHVVMTGEFDNFLFNPTASDSKTLSLSPQ
jgi:hypothetical protein